MNARLYDPETARFLSADIYIQAPESSQSHNRYIYVMNNPLKYSDPSGHFWNFIIGAVISIISSQIDNPYIRAIGMIAGAALMGGQIGFEGLGTGLFGGEAIFANAFAAGFVGGGISSGSAKGAFIGGFSALATAGIGHGGTNKSTYFQKGFRTVLAHGVAQGATAELRGGSFRSGFIGGFASGYAPNLGIDQKSTSAGLVLARTSVAGVFGGLVTQASGGSFKDGAFHATMVHLFNDEYSKLMRSLDDSELHNFGRELNQKARIKAREIEKMNTKDYLNAYSKVNSDYINANKASMLLDLFNLQLQGFSGLLSHGIQNGISKGVAITVDLANPIGKLSWPQKVGRAFINVFAPTPSIRKFSLEINCNGVNCGANFEIYNYVD